MHVALSPRVAARRPARRFKQELQRVTRRTGRGRKKKRKRAARRTTSGGPMQARKDAERRHGCRASLITEGAKVADRKKCFASRMAAGARILRGRLKQNARGRCASILSIRQKPPCVRLRSRRCLRGRLKQAWSRVRGGVARSKWPRGRFRARTGGSHQKRCQPLD